MYKNESRVTKKSYTRLHTSSIPSFLPSSIPTPPTPPGPMHQLAVGTLACQHNSYQTSLQTACLSCSTTPNNQGFYEVKLVDT
ncbi:hypothetical protein BC938DRAFT_482421, partial [Jimgerdemannia flammicorona]